MTPPNFDRASVALIKEVSERLRTMEQRQVRIETRLCKFIQAEGKGSVLHNLELDTASGFPAKEPIDVDQGARTMAVPHLGVSLRTMMGAALANWTNPQPQESRRYAVHYKNVPVATLSVRQHPHDPSKD